VETTIIAALITPHRVDDRHHSGVPAMTITEIYQSTQALKPLDKAKLVELILADLDQPDPAIEAAWIEEVERRQAEVKAGTVKLRTAEEVFGKYA
jgi:Putative addiction module component